jgi:hypothetical protein
MLILIFFAGMLSAFLLIDIMKKVLILSTFNIAEKQLLMISMSLIQYKYECINIIKIVYERAAEDDPKYLEESKKVIEKIHEKFNYFGDEWIKQIKSYLPYETQYNTWYEAVEYLEKLINKKKK